MQGARMLVAGAVLAALAGCSAAYADAVVPATATVPARAQVLEVGADGRSLLLGIEHADGCHTGGAATVKETASAVVLAVTETENDTPDVVCAQEISMSTLRVKLAKPLRGRRIAGLRPMLATWPLRDATLQTIAPRLTGLSRADATAALKAYGVKVAVTTVARGRAARGGQVVGQSVRAHASLRRGDAITLRVAR